MQMQTNQDLTEDLLVSWSARERLTEEVLSPGKLTEQLRQSPHVRAGLPLLDSRQGVSEGGPTRQHPKAKPNPS